MTTTTEITSIEHLLHVPDEYFAEFADDFDRDAIDAEFLDELDRLAGDGITVTASGLVFAEVGEPADRARELDWEALAEEVDVDAIVQRHDRTMSRFEEGDPVWVHIQAATDLITGEPAQYEGTGVVWGVGPRTLIVQTGGTAESLDAVTVAVDNAGAALAPYRRPLCRYCASLRLVVKGKAGDRVRWTCADCMGEQDT